MKEANKGLGKFLITRPMDSIFEHLKELVKTRNVELFLFADECFLAHPTSWLDEFAERYREIVLPFIIQTRPETVNEKRIRILKSSGAPFFQVSVGVESGSEHILFNVCNRKTPIKKIYDAFDILHEYGVRSSSFFMLGFPEETRLDIFKSVEVARRIRSTVSSIAIYQPLPGQQLTEDCIDAGYITGMEPMATFTSDSILKMPQISSEEIVNLRRTFALYSNLPKDYFRDIKKCETSYEENKKLFEELVALRWKLHDDPSYVVEPYSAEEIMAVLS